MQIIITEIQKEILPTDWSVHDALIWTVHPVFHEALPVSGPEADPWRQLFSLDRPGQAAGVGKRIDD